MKKLSNPIFFTELSKRSPVLLSPLKSTCWLANREGLGKIKTKFKEIDSQGPIWVTNFEEIDDEEEKERVKRDVFERVNAFLDGLGIEPL
jgi:hypothetical protein